MANVNTHLDASHSCLTKKKESKLPDKLFLPGQIPINIQESVSREHLNDTNELIGAETPLDSGQSYEIIDNFESDYYECASAKTTAKKKRNVNITEKGFNEVKVKTSQIPVLSLRARP